MKNKPLNRRFFVFPIQAKRAKITQQTSFINCTLRYTSSALALKNQQKQKIHFPLHHHHHHSDHSILGHRKLFLKSNIRHQSTSSFHMSTNTPLSTFRRELDPVQLASSLKTKKYGRYLLHRTVTETTMTIADREISEGAPEGTLIFAEEQTQGRGRVEGRSWTSPRGCNIMFSLILRMQSDFFRIPLAIPIAVTRALRELGINAHAKWPNDVWVAGKKISGCLINSGSKWDAELRQSIYHQALGIAINVNHLTHDIPDPQLRESSTSVRDILQRPVDREPILASILNHLEDLCDLPMSMVVEEYSKVDLLLGKNIIVMPKKKEDPERRFGKAIKLDLNGALVVQFDKTEETLYAEEVSIRPEDAPQNPLINSKV